MKRLVYTITATKQRRKLAADIRTRIDIKLGSYAAGGSADVRSMVGREGSRLRIGDWRVIFVESDEEILVVAVGNRRDVYG